MSYSSARTTAETGKTVLALVAILSLLLSLFAIVRPAIAFDDAAGPAVVPTVPPGNPSCPAGTTEIKFEGANLASGKSLSATIDGELVTVTITNVDVGGGSFDFEVDGGVAMVVIAKGGPNANVYDYRPGGAAHDDGLTTPINPNNNSPFGLSHISFCVVPIVAEIEVTKDGPDLSKVGDPTDYTITIENTGNVVLHLESVEDSLAGDLTAAVIAECGTLAVDELCSYSYSYTPVVGDADPLLNTVEVTANSAADFSGAEATGSASASVNLFQPDIEVTKTGDVTEAEVGDVVTYTVLIENLSSSDSPDLVFDLIDDSLQGDLTDPANVDSSDCGATLAAETSCTIVYSRTVLDTDPDPLVNTVSVESHPDGFPNNIDDSDSWEVDIPAPPLGSITVNKEVDCEECVTRTPGFWFNSAGSHDDETNALMAELAAADGGSDPAAVEVNIDGTVYEFVTAADVRAFVAADTSGEWDDEAGLSRDGALLRHYLSTLLNVALNGEECDLLSRELNGQTVEEILAEAAAALEADDEDAEVAALEKLTAINESDDAEENPLTCGDSGNTSGDGFMFELFAEADFPDGDPIDSGTTGDDGPGTLIFSDLPLGTYVLVETGNDSEQECEIVSVDGGVLNADGTVTVEITEETPDVVLTIVNECENGEEEPNPGDITVIKEAGDDAAAEFAFSATWDGDGFVLTDGDSEFSGDLEAGEYTVTETLTPEQIAAGWTLADIDCGDAAVEVDLAASTVTITLGEDDHVTCTFTNELEEEEENGLVEIDKLFCFTDEEASTEFFVFGPTTLPPTGTAGVDEETPEEGCWTEAVSFTITGGDLEEPLEVMTDENGILEIELPASENAYVITEDLSGESAEFFVEDGAITTIAVLNLIPEDEAGLVKVIKLFCEGDEAGVSFSVEGGDAPAPVLSDCEVGDATFELGDLEITTEDGIAIVLVDVGEYTFAETDPNEATYDGTVVVEEGEITTIIVINTFEEGEEPGGGGPGGNETPREGTQGGNPLPNTATSPIPAGSAPAALLALLMLGGLGAASYAVRAEARRRR
jgi:uncharacterized repeat protein (TIGR01451 family)